MTPYTKQIVELHKIHKAIENCGSNRDKAKDLDLKFCSGNNFTNTVM